MYIDVDVRHALDAIPAAQRIDHNAAVVEHTETCRARAPCVMQTADRLEAPIALTLHHLFQAFERRTYDARRCVVYARIRRRVAVVDRTVPLDGKHANALHMRGL